MARAGLWGEILDADPASWPTLLDGSEAPREPWRDLARRGGYPVPAHQLSDGVRQREWMAAYAATYLERDVRQLSAIGSLADMRRVMAALCLRTGGLLNQAEVARDLGVPATTVQRFIGLLEISYQLVRVPGFAVNRTKRLIKAPKVYWSDTGLALHLSGEPSARGAHLENLVVNDLLAWAGSRTERPSLLHWRTAGGAEVDFVVELPGRLLPIEVKASRRVGHADARHLRSFLADYPEAPAGLLLDDGDEVFWVDRGVLAAPWWRVV